MVTAVSSVEVERSFSILGVTKTKRRNRLGDNLLQHLLRARINGPRSIDQFPALGIAKAWARKGKMLTDASPTLGNFASHRKTADINVDEIEDDDWPEDEDIEDGEMGERIMKRKFLDNFLFTFDG